MVVRSKGYFWLAAVRNSQVHGRRQVALRARAGGMWWAGAERTLAEDASLKFIMSNWIDGIGDAVRNSFLLEWI